jgi:RNA polymerase sigma-70 factor (ECF subfamily)
MPPREDLAQTLHAVLQGNPDAFLGIVREFGPGLRAFLTSQLFQLDAVDDLAQDTFIAAYRSLHTFRLDEDFGAWLRGIARNKLRRHFENARRHVTALDQFRAECRSLMHSELEALASQTEADHLQAMLHCIARLPERMRKVVRANLEGHRGETVAEELQTTPGAVYQLQYRALHLLRECIAKEAPHGA